MDLAQAVLALSRDPNMVAYRPTGTVICVRPNLQVFKTFIAKPYRWVPSFHDYVAQDWQITMATSLAAQIEAANQQQEAG